MNNLGKIKNGDKVAILGLSDGILGEDFVAHEIVLLEKRLKEVFCLDFMYMNNSLRGAEYLKNPEARAEDLKQAFLDDTVKIIWTTIGGDDTFRTLPYLMTDDFQEIVKNNPKIFIGMSDTTNNHLMLYKMGLKTFYGPSLLADIAELGPEIFPFTVKWLKYLFNGDSNITVESSPVWYRSRKSFGKDQLGVSREEMDEEHGHEYLYGRGKVSGRLLGGCLDSLYESLVGGRYDDQSDIFAEYNIFPDADEWKGKILFIETSEEHPSPSRYQSMLDILGDKGVLQSVKAIIVGKPQDEVYYNDYKNILMGIAEEYNLPVVYNLNFGHTTPRMVIPYGGLMNIDFDNHKIVLPDGVLG